MSPEEYETSMNILIGISYSFAAFATILWIFLLQKEFKR